MASSPNINLNKLRNLRNKRKLSQQEIADKLGISRSAYAKWENGKTNISLDHLKTLSDVLGKDFMELISELTGKNANIGGVVGSMGDYGRVYATDQTLLTEIEKLQSEIERLQSDLKNKDISLHKELKNKDELLHSKEEIIKRYASENQTLQELVAALRVQLAEK